MDLRIGILECDHVVPELQGKYGDYQDMFTDLVQKQDSSLEITVYDLTSDQFPVDLHACDAYFITGSKAGVYEDIPWIHKAKQLVKHIYEAKIPTIGICFGHQLIAESLGGKVVKAEDKGRGLGVQTWQITDKQNWMDGIPNELSLNACHQDQVIEMPEKSKLFASSDFCPIAGFQTESMLAFQGHPEFDYDYTKHLVEKYHDTQNDEEMQATLKSLALKPDSDLVGEWMVSFIKKQLEKSKLVT